MTAEPMEFENGGLFTKPTKSHHDYLRIRKDYDWVFSGVERELIRLGNHVGYESGHIGRDEKDDAFTITIEIFVGQNVDREYVETSFDLTVKEERPRRANLTFGPMPNIDSSASTSFPSAQRVYSVTDEVDEDVVFDVSKKMDEISKIIFSQSRKKLS